MREREGNSVREGGKRGRRRREEPLTHYYTPSKSSLSLASPRSPLQKLAASVAQSKLFLCGDEARKDSTHLIHICKAQERGRKGGREGDPARKQLRSEGRREEKEEEERISRDTDNGGSFSVLFEQRYEGCSQTSRVGWAKQRPCPSLLHRRAALTLADPNTRSPRLVLYAVVPGLV